MSAEMGLWRQRSSVTTAVSLAVIYAKLQMIMSVKDNLEKGPLA